MVPPSLKLGTTRFVVGEPFFGVLYVALLFLEPPSGHVQKTTERVPWQVAASAFGAGLLVSVWQGRS